MFRPAAGRGWLLAALLGATVLGTISNNIVNVPLRQIIADFDAPVTQGVLVASASVLVLAVAMPLTGWISDRLGRRRTLLLALAHAARRHDRGRAGPDAGAAGGRAAALQGLGVRGGAGRRSWACWPAPSPPEHRNRVMGAWGAANGIGQAIGPPVGGLVADAFGWRAIFGAPRPAHRGRADPDPAGGSPGHAASDTRMDWLGASTLTVGVALLMTAATAAPQPGIPAWLPVAGARPRPA